jgi:branched-chain amino acid transport system permease protein
MTEREAVALAPAIAAPPRLALAGWGWAVLAAALMAALPAVAPSLFLVSVATSMLITALAAASLHLVIRTGHVSLGHAGFMGVGAYTGTLLTTALHWPFTLAAVAAFATPALLALAVGPLVLRLTGKYFVLGANGIFQIPAPPGVTGQVAFFYFVLAVTTLLLAGIARILASEIGRAMDAVRQSERLAQCAGIPVLKVKIGIFVLSCGLAGIAGVLQAWFVHFIDPGSFSGIQSLNLVVINVIGGMTSLPGTLCGTVFLTVLPELLRSYVELQRILFGIILIVVMAAVPGGLAEAGTRLRRPLARRRAR